ncbi:MAG: alpha-ribazole phosphatase family protein [Rhodocyclaceae bacterium]|nr:alpha-ribazole phosphatase family protein [Rhodocyclaceae bacterium]
MRLWLIRHPPPAVPPGLCYGATDLPLAEDPAPLAEALRPLLPAGAPLFTSPLQRCRLLAERLHEAPIVDARLAELNFGDWEMQPWERLDRVLIEAWAADPARFQPPGGERVADFQARVAAFLAELPEEAVVVAHAGVIKVCAAMLADEPEWFGLAFEYGSLTLIERGVRRAVWPPRDARKSAARDRCQSQEAPSPR